MKTGARIETDGEPRAASLLRSREPSRHRSVRFIELLVGGQIKVLEAIHSRLGFGTRLGLISGLFCLPIALLLFLFVQSDLQQLDFSNKEIAGSRFLEQVWSATTRGGEVPSANGQFNEGEAARALAAATTPDARLTAGAALISAVADGSNLTLDPDLDSFYTQDAVTVELPSLYVAASEVRNAAASGNPAALAVALDHLSTTANRTQSVLQTAMRNNASGQTRQALEARAGALTSGVEAVRRAASSGQAAETATAVNALQTSISDVWPPPAPSSFACCRPAFRGSRT